MKKQIIKQILSMLMVICVISNTTVISLGEEVNDEASIVFKYTEADSTEFIPDGTNLIKGKDYELHIYFKDIASLNGFTLPFHFNPQVVQLISYEDDQIVSNWNGIDADAFYFTGSGGILFDEDFLFGDFGVNLTVNPQTPVFNSSTGYFTMTAYGSSGNTDISGEQRVLKIRFRAVNTGKVNFRDAVSRDGDVGVDYDGTAPDGFRFSKLGGENIDVKRVYDSSKYVYAPATGIDILESSVSIGALQKQTLEAVVYPDDADQTVIWESSDKDIATVDSKGNVTGISPGNATITAYTSDRKFSDTCEVKIIDVSVPSVPGDLKIEWVTGSRAVFSWGASSGYYGVDGYIVYRDGEKIATVDNGDLVYEDTALTTNKEYKYTVAAYYGSTVSKESQPLIITPKGVNVTSVAPENYSAIGGNGNTKFTVFYDNTYNAKNAKVYMSGGKASEAPESYQIENIKTGVSGESNWFSFDFDMSEITQSGDYKFIFTVEDADGFKDSYEAHYNVDVTPPSVITGFTAVGYQEYNMLSWNKSVEANTGKYLIYRSTEENGTYSLVTTVNNRDKVTYKDSDVQAGTTYYYYIVAEDIFGQRSDKSDIVSATPLADTTPPEVYYLKVTPDSDVLSGTVTVEFTVHDDVSLDKIEFQYSIEDGTYVKYDEQTLTSDKATFKFDTTEFEDGNIKIRAVVYDKAGNYSDGSPERQYVIDNTGPSKPVNLTASKILSSSLHLSWDDVADKDREYYVVEYKKADSNEALKSITNIKALGVDVDYLSTNTKYEFYVTAYDKYGNRGETSDVLYVTTVKDTEVPKIISITPYYKNISKDTEVYFTATDDSGIDYADIEVSFNGGAWEKIGEVDVTSTGTKVVFKHTLEISGYPEGTISIRAIPVDTSGNRGDSSANALSNSYYIDRTPVDVPLNVVANACDNADAIEVRWDITDLEKENNKDFLCYVVYRSESENGTYEIVNPNCTNINYIDYNVEFNKTYYYKVKTSDKCENLSEFSNVASASIQDTEKPEFYSIYPKNNGYIGNDMTITVNVKDNNKLSYVELWYKTSSGSWECLERKDASTASMMAKFVLDRSAFGEGTYTFKVVADDTTNVHKVTSPEMTYHIDRTAPVISNLEAVAGEESVTLTWDCDNISDLSGYYVYYKTEGGYYSSSSNATVSAKDKTVTISGLDSSYKYQFKLVAMDYAGNKSQLESELISPLPKPDTGEEKDTTPPVVMMNVPSVFTVGEEGSFDAAGSYDNVEIKSYKWEFGDGSVSEYRTAAHAYSEVGEYNVKLIITDTSGNVATGVKTIRVKEKKDVAIVRIQVKDDKGNIIPDANVIFDYSTEKASKYISNSAGVVEIETEEGEHVVGVYKDGYLPAEKKVVAHKNDTEEVIVRLIQKNIVIGSLKWERMTLEDIIEAGIDTSDPANQNIYSFEVKIVIGEEEIIAKGHKAVNNFDDNFTPIELETSVPVSAGGKNINQKIYIYDFNDKTNFHYDSDDSSISSKQPQTFVATLSTPGEISWLKEFFDVELTVSNQADEQFVIDGCEVLLNYSRDGLTLMTDLENAQGSAYVELGSIAGQQTKTVNWVLRGDVEGEYPISADFYGELRGFDTAIQATFASETPIKVYGDSGMSIVVESENVVNGYDDYSFRIGLRNESPIEKYLPDVTVEETEYIKAVDGYHNYAEIDGYILRTNADTLYPRETLYSEYVLNGLTPEQLTIEFVQKKLSEKFGNSYASLPVYYRVVPQYSFNKSLLTILSEKEKLPATIKLYRDEEKTVTINVSKFSAESSQYINCANENIYVKQEGGEYGLLGQTDANGCINYTFKVPANYEGENYRISIRANRTGEEYIDIFVLGESKVCLEGTVKDQYGNPVSKANVEVAGKQTQTDYSGHYKLEGLDRGKTRIVIRKDGYESVDKNLVLNAGHIIKNYKMKQTPKHKPKIISVSSNIADDASDEIIVPLGLDKEYVLDVKAKALDGGRVEKYIIELVKADGSVMDVSESTTSQVSYNFKNMELGDSLNVYVRSIDNVESLRTKIPVKIVETPFVNILNVSDNVKSDEKTINECYSYKLPVSKLFREQWLTGDFASSWDDLYNKFKVKMTLGVAADNDELKSETQFDINWFDYVGYDVTAKYDFTNGDLRIFPGYVTVRGRDVYESNSYSRFALEETIDEDIHRASSSKYSWLECWNRLCWYIDGGFNVEFNLDSKNDADTWKGSFNLWSEDSKDFYGTYYRKMNRYEYIVSNSNKEYLEGVWNKNLEVHQDEIIDLTEEGISNSEFVMDYTTSTQGSWKNGISNITLTSESKNEIYLLPEARIKGITTLGGDYYVLGYRYKLYGGSETTQEYDTGLNKNLLREASANEIVLDSLTELNADTEFVAITKSSNPQESGADGVIANNVFANTQNAVSDGDEKLLVYLNNNEDRATGEQSQVVYRRYNNGSWSEEKAIIPDDKTADYTPYVKDTPYGIMSVWADSTGNTYNNQDMTMEEISNHIASQLSISLAIYNPDTNTWSDAISLNENNHLDYAPVIASQETDENPLVMACWISNKDNNMTDGNRKDEIMFSIFDGMSWSEPESIFGETLGAVSNLKIEEQNGVFHILFSMQTVNDGGTPDDTSDDVVGESRLQSAMYSNGRWSINRALNAKEEADGFSDFMVEENELQVVYTNSMYLNRVNATTREAREERTENSLINTASEMISVPNDDFNVLAWISNPTDAQKIYLNTLKDGVWSENIEVVSAAPNEVIANLKAFVDGDKVVVVYNKYVYETVENEYTLSDVKLCSEKIVIASDISVENLEADDISVMKNKDVHFAVKVKNNGIDDVETYTVRLKGSAFDKPIEKVVNETLKGGEEKTINIDWTATEITDSFEVVATVIEDGIESLTTASFVLTPYDTEVGEVTLEEAGGELTAIIKLENHGYVDVPGYKVKVEKETGELLKEIDFDEVIAHDGIKTITIDLTEFLSDLSTANTRLKFTISTGLVEFDENNNFMFKNIQTENTDYSSWAGSLDFSYDGEEELKVEYFADTQISVDVATDENAAVDANESGNFEIQAPSGKTYDVTISRKGVLTRTVKDVEFSDAAAMSASAIELIPGDVVQDSTNSINPNDIARMISLIGYGSDKAQFDGCADFNASGSIGAEDLNVLLSNAGKNTHYYDMMK